MSEARDLHLTLVYCAAASAVLAVEPPAAVGLLCLMPLVLFAPGHALVRALDPPSGTRRAADHAVLAIALSFGAVVLGGLVLNGVFSLTRLAWAVWLVALTALASLVALARVHGSVAPSGSRTGETRGPRPLPRPRRATVAGASLALVAVAGAVVVNEISAHRWYRTPLTELSLEGASPRAARLTVSNHSGTRQTYRLSLTVGRSLLDSFDLTVAASRSWTQVVPATMPITATIVQTGRSDATSETVRWNG
jgi:hypothetical protein